MKDIMMDRSVEVYRKDVVIVYNKDIGKVMVDMVHVCLLWIFMRYTVNARKDMILVHELMKVHMTEDDHDILLGMLDDIVAVIDAIVSKRLETIMMWCKAKGYDHKK